MTRNRCLFLSALLPLAFAAQASEPDAATLAFADTVAACSAGGFSSPHPFVKDFTIVHTVVGEKNGACEYSQTMPGNMRMECALSEDGRKALAEEFREQAKGRMSGATTDAPAWSAECEIVTRDGKRMPMQGG